MKIKQVFILLGFATSKTIKKAPKKRLSSNNIWKSSKPADQQQSRVPVPSLHCYRLVAHHFAVPAQRPYCLFPHGEFQQDRWPLMTVPFLQSVAVLPADEPVRPA